MRWRALMNSLERTGARDTLERFSLAVDKIGPIVAVVLLVPLLIGVSVLSAIGGYLLATRPDLRPIADIVLRAFAFGLSGLAIVGPIVFPIMERTNPVRLMLLPIPRTTLYVAQASGSFADPWTMVAAPLAIFFPAGLAAGLAFETAVVSTIAGLLFLVVLVGLSTLTGCVIQLVMRDRRRGELAALAFVLLIPLIGISMNVVERNVSRRNRHRVTPVERTVDTGPADRVARAAFRMTPSEQYVRAITVSGGLASSAGALALLATTAALVHGSALLVFGRLLAFPGTISGHRAASRRMKAPRRIPGLSAAASAVAMAQIRLTLRTPRGRSAFLAPLLAFLLFTILSLRAGSPPFSLEPNSGLGLAAFGAFFSVMATLPFAMNQFALDGAGLTLELLSPLSDQDLLDGKAFAIGAMASAPACVCLLVAFFLFPNGSPALWISIPIGVAAICLLVAPIAAAVSATFPRAVDLNSIGHGSNPHSLAGLIGVATIVLSGLPVGVLALGTLRWLQRPELTLVLLLIWCAVALAINRLLFRPVRLLLARRRENLAIVVG
jgi:hypothetical protein